MQRSGEGNTMSPRQTSIKLGIVALTTRKVDQGRQDIEKDVKYEYYESNRIKKTGEGQEMFKRTI